MTATAKELFRTRQGDAHTSRQREYLVTESDPLVDELDESAALTAAVEASPDSIQAIDGFPLFRGNAEIVRELSNKMMVIAVQYGEAGISGTPLQSPGSVEYEFNYQAPSEKIYFSLATRAYAPPGKIPPKMFNRIKVDPETGKPEGLDISAGTTTNTWRYTIAGAITLAYESLVENLMGTVNLFPFKTRPAGTMRLVTASSRQSSSSKTTIEFGFHYSPNVTNLQVGNILVERKDGHELMWDIPEGVEDNDAQPKQVVWPSKAIYVEKVFRDGDFSLLGI